MGSKLYKYLAPEILHMAFSKPEVCILKCSYPKDFNDPYELYLTIDFQQEPDLLATYKDTIGQIPQLPTTCFSNSPGVIPMWAHYANNHQGVVLEIDEKKLSEKLPELSFGNVDYLDGPSDDLLDMLIRASRIGKPRYHYLLQSGVFSAAYFTKHSSWSYELERRVIANETLVNKVNGHLFLSFPVECVTALIVGHNASDETKNMALSLAKEISAKYFELKIGRTMPEPYFVDSKNFACIYKLGKITMSEIACQKCNEPLLKVAKLCPWCSITTHHEEYAMRTNPMRMLQHYGLLEDYYKGMQEIQQKHRKK